MKAIDNYFTRLFLLSLCLFFPSTQSYADGSFIDKVYHPYVQPHERELEWRWIYQKDSDKKQLNNSQVHRLAYGQSVSENWFIEAYLIGEKNHDSSFRLSALELEALNQITEQGEFFADFGLLFELEHERDLDVSEISSALLIEKEWGKFSGTANLYLIYEWGNKIDNELETAMSLQAKYRYSRNFEPAIEFYSSDNSEGIGPVFVGDVKLSGRKKIHWETGVIFDLDNETADETFKFLIEYEF